MVIVIIMFVGLYMTFQSCKLSICHAWQFCTIVVFLSSILRPIVQDQSMTILGASVLARAQIPPRLATSHEGFACFTLVIGKLPVWQKLAKFRSEQGWWWSGCGLQER